MNKKIIGLYELITGVIGAIIILIGFEKPFGSTENAITYVAGILLFAGATYAGYALMNNIRNGVKYSIWVQAAQSFSLLIPGFMYKFTGSAFLSVIGGTDGFRFNFSLQPIDYAIVTTNSNTTEIQVYLVALVLLVLLIKERK